MFTRPPDLPDEAVASALARGWGVEATTLAYAPVGFGSHHWHAATSTLRWFLTVDDLDARRRDETDTRHAARQRLVAALSTALALRSAGVDVAIAPIPSRSDQVIEPIDDRYVLAVYPWIEGVAGAFGPFANRAERLEAVDLLVAVHRTPTDQLPTGTDDHQVPSRDQLAWALTELDEPWTTGPFAEPTRDLLQRHRQPLLRVLAAYDELVAHIEARPRSVVITHGEPHRGNIIRTAGGLVLIDWDTTLLAPPERDLWRLIDEDPDVRSHYEQSSRRALDDAALRLYSLWWDLCEVALFVADFRRPHTDTADTRTGWQGLEHHLDPSRWLDLI